MKKQAWVSGNKIEGYRLCIEGAALEHFDDMNGARFASYKPAQAMANAINAYMSGKAGEK